MSPRRNNKKEKKGSRGGKGGKGRKGGKGGFRDDGREGGQDREGRFKRRRRVCVFCADKIVADYKDLSLLNRFISDRGKILPRRTSGNCAKHQRFIATEIKRARELGMLPYQLD